MSDAPMFYVLSNRDHLVPAKFLIGLDGQPVRNPNPPDNPVNSRNSKYFDLNMNQKTATDINPNNYYVAPVNYDINTAINQGIFNKQIMSIGSISSLFEMQANLVTGILLTGDVARGGDQDYQKYYLKLDGTLNTDIYDPVPLFQDSTSFNYGIYSKTSGFTSGYAETAGSAYGVFSSLVQLKSINISNIMRNNTSTQDGFDYLSSHPIGSGTTPLIRP